MTTTKAPLPELLPCPFCANEKPFAISYIHSHQFACTVVCSKDNCGSSGTWYSRESEDAAKNVAYKAWNTRANWGVKKMSEEKSVTISQELLDRMIEGLDAFRGCLPNRRHGETMTLHEVFVTLKNLRSACN